MEKAEVMDAISALVRAKTFTEDMQREVDSLQIEYDRLCKKQLIRPVQTA